MTGGSGYLGSVLVGTLLRQGFQVTVLDNLLYGQASLLSYCSHPAFEFVRGDARDERVLAEAVRGQDAVIPLAAIVGAPACDRDPLAARSVNLDAIRLLDQLRARSQAVVWPCTNSGYGTKSGDVHCTEATPLEPISLYGRTKVEAEAALLESGEAVSLRLATVFGPSPRMRLDLLVNDFVHRAVTEGTLVIYEGHFKRNFVHIEDVADCFVHCLRRFADLKGEAYNVGLDEANLSKQELAEKIRLRVPTLQIVAADKGSDPDQRNYIVSNEKLRRKGFVARRSLEDGIRQLIRAYQMLPRGPFANA